MIPSDRISISVLGKEGGYRDSGYVRNDGGNLTTDGRGSDNFFFKDFKQSFLAVGSTDDSAIKQVDHDGDEWELVP